MNRAAKHQWSTVLFLLIPIGAWFAHYGSLYFGADTLLMRDSHGYHFNTVYFILEWIRSFNAFPDWVFSPSGGVWLAPLTNNLLLLMPHRIAGYGLAWLTSADAIVLHKFCLFGIGLGVFLSGIYWLARQLGFSRQWSAFAVLCTFFGPIHLTLIHQEQILGTVFYLPFLWLFFLRSASEPKYFPLWAACLGLSFNNHYPHLILIYGLILALSCFLEWDFCKPFLLRVWRSFRYSRLRGITALSFALSVSPLLVSFILYSKRLGSDMRVQGSIFSSGYLQWVHVHYLQQSSLQPRNLLRYLQLKLPFPSTRIHDTDALTLFVLPGVLFALVAAFFCRFPGRKFQGATMALLGLASFGVHGFLLPLFWATVPGVVVFRQWFHLLPILNLHLLFFCLIVFRRWPAQELSLKAWWGTKVFGVLSVAATLMQVFVSQWTGWMTALVFLAKGRKALPARAALAWTASLFLFVLLNNVQYSRSAVENVYRWKAEPEMAAFYRSRSLFTEAQIRKGGSPLGLIRAREVDSEKAQQAYAGRGPYFETAEGGRLAEPPILKVGTSGSDFQLQLSQVPAKASVLILPQLDDGNWLVAAQGKTQRTKRNAFGFVRIPVSPGANEIKFGRNPDRRWRCAALLCWLPLLSGLYLVTSPKTFTTTRFFLCPSNSA